MTRALTISQNQAKNLIIHSQGLSTNSYSSLAAIRQLSYIQIDTISVTERAHNHVFYSRNHSFQQEEINQLMNNKSIFEYWSHAAAYLPIEDFRYSLYRKKAYKTGEQHWFPRDKKVDKYVLDRIKTEGPLQSKDFKTPIKSKGWYEWKPAKIALTNLFMDGSIMVKNRKGFQKVFDLTERVIPTGINTTQPTLDEYCNHLIMNAIRAHGLISLNEICYLRKGIKESIKKILNELIETKVIREVFIKNNPTKYYTLPTENHIPINNNLHILSPFDNLIIQRKRVKEVFNFDYQIECYVPEKKRKYGYFTMPILYKNNFVARMDAKADRKTKLFTVNNIWLENNFRPDDDFFIQFNQNIKSYSKFCGCNVVKVNKVSPNNYKQNFDLKIIDNLSNG